MWRILFLFLIFGINPALAQNRATILKQTNNSKIETFNKTRIIVVLITEGTGVGLGSRQWNKIFRDENISLQVRRPRSRDKVETRELKLGTIRKVTLVGKIKTNGTLIFEGHTFKSGQTEQLIMWLDEIRKYGSQGSPSGKQLWGLNKDQFDEVFKVLSEPLAEKVKGQNFSKSLMAFHLPSSIPCFVSQDAKDWLIENQLHVAKLPQELKGISKGTALSYMLRNYGLGGYPLRMADGSIRFQVEPIKKGQVYWPIGWDSKSDNLQTAPTLFRFEFESLDETPVDDVLGAIAAKSRVPILVDYYNLKIHDIDISSKMFSQRQRKMALMTLIKRVVTPQFLKAELKVDERGKPLVWCSCMKRSRKKKR